jgi:hypothetical protein
MATPATDNSSNAPKRAFLVKKRKKQLQEASRLSEIPSNIAEEAPVLASDSEQSALRASSSHSDTDLPNQSGRTSNGEIGINSSVSNAEPRISSSNSDGVSHTGSSIMGNYAFKSNLKSRYDAEDELKIAGVSRVTRQKRYLIAGLILIK